MPEEEPIASEKKILIAKKFVLSQRILAKVLSNLGYDYDILEDVKKLDEKPISNDYDILFTDVELVTEKISESNENIAIISSSNTKNPQKASVHKGETIASNASKEEIDNIIKKYRG